MRNFFRTRPLDVHGNPYARTVLGSIARFLAWAGIALVVNRHKNKRGGKGGDGGNDFGRGGQGSGKIPVVGAVSRKGNVVARVIDNVRAATLTEFVRESVSHKVSLLCTDECAS